MKDLKTIDVFGGKLCEISSRSVSLRVVIEKNPWLYIEVDISDYFIFGLNKESWKYFCKQLNQHRIEITMQSRVCVYESGRTDQGYDPDETSNMLLKRQDDEISKSKDNGQSFRLSSSIKKRGTRSSSVDHEDMGGESKTKRSSESSKERSGSHMDYQQLKDGAKEESIQDKHNARQASNRKRDIDLVKFDPAKSVLEQGNLDCIIHKLYDVCWKDNLNKFCEKCPSVPVIDLSEAIERLHNRVSILEVITQLRFLVSYSKIFGEPEPEAEPKFGEEKEKKERKQKALKKKEMMNAVYKEKDFESAIKHYSTAMEINDEDDDYGVEWQTKTSRKASEKRMKEQLTFVTAKMIILSAKDAKVEKKATPKVKGDVKTKKKLVEVMKDYMKTFISSLPDLAQDIFDALFEVMFDGLGKGIAKEVMKKKSHLVAATKQKDGSQIYVLNSMMAKALTRKGTALVKMDKSFKDYEHVIEAYHKTLTEHRNMHTLERLNEEENKELEQQEYFDSNIGDEEHEKGNQFLKEQKHLVVVTIEKNGYDLEEIKDVRKEELGEAMRKAGKNLDDEKRQKVTLKGKFEELEKVNEATSKELEKIKAEQGRLIKKKKKLENRSESLRKEKGIRQKDILELKRDIIVKKTKVEYAGTNAKHGLTLLKSVSSLVCRLENKTKGEQKEDILTDDFGRIKFKEMRDLIGIQDLGGKKFQA